MHIFYVFFHHVYVYLTEIVLLLIAGTIDRTLKNHDDNNDGFLTYSEYTTALDKQSIKL